MPAPVQPPSARQAGPREPPPPRAASLRRSPCLSFGSGTEKLAAVSPPRRRRVTTRKVVDAPPQATGEAGSLLSRMDRGLTAVIAVMVLVGCAGAWASA